MPAYRSRTSTLATHADRERLFLHAGGPVVGPACRAGKQARGDAAFANSAARGAVRDLDRR